MEIFGKTFDDSWVLQIRKMFQDAIKNNDMKTLKYVARMVLQKEGSPHFQEILNLNKRDDNGLTPVAVAAKLGRIKMLDYLLRICADQRVLSGPNNWASAYEVTPLFFAASEGHAECVKELLVSGAYVDRINKTDYFRTALEIAAFKGYPECVKLLCQDGAAIKLTTRTDLLGFETFASTVEHSALDAAIEGANADKYNVAKVPHDPWTFKVYRIDKEGHQQCLDILCEKIVDHYVAQEMLHQSEPEFRELIKTILDLLLDLGNDVTKTSGNRVRSLLNTYNYTKEHLQQARNVYSDYERYVKEKNSELREELRTMINDAIANVGATNKDKEKVANPNYYNDRSDPTTPLLPKTPSKRKM